MRRFVMCLLLTGLSGCSFIPTWTTKGWVKEQMAKVVQDSNLAVAEKIAAVIIGTGFIGPAHVEAARRL